MKEIITVFDFIYKKMLKYPIQNLDHIHQLSLNGLIYINSDLYIYI